MARILVNPRIGVLNTHFMTGALGTFDQMVAVTTFNPVIENGTGENLIDADGETMVEDSSVTYQPVQTSDLP